jgi:FKBP-type peptidyl-prolyl cis-trans isomerase FkpA
LGLYHAEKSARNLILYDKTQILNYIAANGITGMHQDTVGGDTSGIYYKVILRGSGAPLTYTDNVSFVFTLRTFDGKYISSDTIVNHYSGYVGHITNIALPAGLELAIVNDLRLSGGSMRVLIPSYLAYGVNGYGSGSINVAGTHIAGNQCLDYYVHVIANQSNNVYGTNTLGYQYVFNPAQAAYDDQVIQNYLTANGLTYSSTPTTNSTTYNRVQSKNIPGEYYYYVIRTAGTGTDSINQNSTITATHAGRLLNNTFFDQGNNAIADTISNDIPTLPLGVQEALSHATTGATVSMILPSALSSGTGFSVPANSCVRYEYEIKRVSP